MRITFLEAFYGGSHRDVADSVSDHSRHQVTLHILPARFWKWRMRGASLTFAQKLNESGTGDLIVSGGMMSLADLTGLSRVALPPILLYAHETQLSYPAPNASDADLHFPFTDLVNMLTATTVVFNSRSHRDAFLGALPGFLRRLPEHRPMWAIDDIAARSRVCYPGIRWTPSASGPAETNGSRTPLIIWNHRWEFDKSPEVFFRVLARLKDRGLAFSLALLGENFKVVPREFDEAREHFADRIAHYGYVPDRSEYERWLCRGDIVVSTAIQENFGISVMEAIAYGCTPLLPRRLSYPELIPQAHQDCLYDSEEQLEQRLEAMIQAAATGRLRNRTDLTAHARSFAWDRRITEFDRLFEETAGVQRA